MPDTSVAYLTSISHRAGRPKINLLPPGIAQVRTVEIVGLDLQADGGTHVARTGEVGRLRVVGTANKGRSNKRLEIAVEDC